MDDDPPQLPDSIKVAMRKDFLRQLRGTSSFSVYELDLFEWYVNETETVLEKMLESEREFIDEQIATEAENLNDSGIVAAEYYTKRIRYSHVIYMASLLEVFLEQECTRLTQALGPGAISFQLREIKGDQWSTKRKYLERYGQFKIPDAMWTEVTDVTTLRNTLVHDNGVVADIPSQDRPRLEACPGISLSDVEVTVEPEFILYAFEKMKEFAQCIESEVAAVVDRAIKPIPVS